MNTSQCPISLKCGKPPSRGSGRTFCTSRSSDLARIPRNRRRQFSGSYNNNIVPDSPIPSPKFQRHAPAANSARGSPGIESSRRHFLEGDREIGLLRRDIQSDFTERRVSLFFSVHHHHDNSLMAPGSPQHQRHSQHQQAHHIAGTGQGK